LRNILIGLALGVVLGIAAALIRETLDTTLRDSDEIRRITRATILGIIPREFDDERLPAATRPHSRRSEAYRQVRTNLEFAAGDEPPRSFVITSAGQGEGKSTTVANLALLISRAGKRVAIVDADLRKPTLATFFNATNEYGLSDVLTGRAGLSEMLQTIAGEQITVLASGPNVPRPSELLSSPAMEHVLTTLHDEFDLVIVDSPPVLAVTDALLVGKHTDGMILISRMRRTTRSGLRRSMEAVERVHARLLGIIVNVAVESEDKRYGYTKGYSKGYLSGYLSEEHEPAAVEAHRVSISDDGPPTGETPAAMQPPPATPLQPVASTPLVPSPPPIVPAQLPVDTWNAGPDPVELPPPATTPPIVDETSEAHLIAAAPAEPEAVAEPEVIPEPETVPEADVVAEPSGLPATPWSQQPIPEWTGQPAYPTAPISPSVGQPQMPTPWIASSAPAPVPWQPEQLEQPAPTYAPNNRGAASSGAVRPDRESGIRSGGKRRRSRSGKGNAQDHER
jgi:capsular exopolysaccharide synthesis family protein